MFVPIVGPIMGMFIIFDTGIALGAISTVQGYPPFVALISELIIAYILARIHRLLDCYGRKHLAKPQANATSLV